MVEGGSRCGFDIRRSNLVAADFGIDRGGGAILVLL